MKKTFKSLLLVFLLVLGGVALVACGNNKALAKDEDAYMVQAVSAVNMGQAGSQTVKSSPNITVDSSETVIDTNIKVEIETNISEQLTEAIDNQLKMLENLLDSIEITHGDSDRDDYEKMSKYSSNDLTGEKVEYTLYYKITEEEIEEDEHEIEFKGLLIVKRGDDEPQEFVVEGEIEIEDGEKEITIIRKFDDGNSEIKISSKLTHGVRKFKYVVDVMGAPKLEFELKVNNQNNNIKLEIETKFGESVVKINMFAKNAGKNREVKLEIELDDFDVLIGEVEADIDINLTITTGDEEVVYNYHFTGEVKFKSHIGGGEVKFEMNHKAQARHNKQGKTAEPIE